MISSPSTSNASMKMTCFHASSAFFVRSLNAAHASLYLLSFIFSIQFFTSCRACCQFFSILVMNVGSFRCCSTNQCPTDFMPFLSHHHSPDPSFAIPMHHGKFVPYTSFIL